MSRPTEADAADAQLRNCARTARAEALLDAMHAVENTDVGDSQVIVSGILEAACLAIRDLIAKTNGDAK